MMEQIERAILKADIDRSLADLAKGHVQELDVVPHF
jgi:hypothetical protein